LKDPKRKRSILKKLVFDNSSFVMNSTRINEFETIDGYNDQLNTSNTSNASIQLKKKFKQVQKVKQSFK
jgi:hypothetical protein